MKLVDENGNVVPLTGEYANLLSVRSGDCMIATESLQNRESSFERNSEYPSDSDHMTLRSKHMSP